MCWVPDPTAEKACLNWLYVWPTTEYGVRPTGMPFKREAKLLTVIGLITKHADFRITFILYPKRILGMMIFLN